jgi:hypothetical protein
MLIERPRSLQAANNVFPASSVTESWGVSHLREKYGEKTNSEVGAWFR